MSADYKVGDRVRVVKRTRNGNDYRFGFVDEMAALEGKIYEIYSISSHSTDSRSAPDDGYCYTLKDSGGFNWASSMFEPVQEEVNTSLSKEEPKVLDFTHKKKYYQLNFSV